MENGPLSRGSGAVFADFGNRSQQRAALVLLFYYWGGGGWHDVPKLVCIRFDCGAVYRERGMWRTDLGLGTWQADRFLASEAHRFCCSLFSVTGVDRGQPYCSFGLGGRAPV